jgi:hypothetical protein
MRQNFITVGFQCLMRTPQHIPVNPHYSCHCYGDRFMRTAVVGLAAAEAGGQDGPIETVRWVKERSHGCRRMTCILQNVM